MSAHLDLAMASWQGLSRVLASCMLTALTHGSSQTSVCLSVACLGLCPSSGALGQGSAAGCTISLLMVGGPGGGVEGSGLGMAQSLPGTGSLWGGSSLGPGRA